MSVRAATAILLFSACVPAYAAQCEATIEGNDAMQFNLKEIVVDAACQEFTLTLKHAGKLPKAAMGHNWVLTKETDFQATTKDGMAAGVANDYLKPNDARVIAHTKMLGGGETDSVTFAVDKLQPGQSYTYFCSFPGHFALMKGVLKVGS